jgi:hypothetical protein
VLDVITGNIESIIRRARARCLRYGRTGTDKEGRLLVRLINRVYEGWRNSLGEHAKEKCGGRDKRRIRRIIVSRLLLLASGSS